MGKTHDTIIEMLRRGPKTTVDFENVNNLRVNWRARISELRAKGYAIVSERMDRGLWKYTLVSEPAKAA